MKTAEEYIRESAALEAAGQLGDALLLAKKGFREYPDNYEMAFMIANDQLQFGHREEAYLYYLLSATLCLQEPEDLAVITETASNAGFGGLNASVTRELLFSLIEDRLKMRIFQSTYRFVSTLIFSDDPFLFREVNDTKLRYYHMLLEITDCEQNRGLTETTADRMKDMAVFCEAVTELKFAIRRIWFRVGALELFSSVCQKRKLSPEFVVICIKCSVTKEYTAAVLDKAASFFEELFSKEEADVIRLYAAWVREQWESSELPKEKRVNTEKVNNVSLVALDAQSSDEGEPPDGFDPENSVAWIFCATKQNYVDEVLVYLRNQLLPPGFSGIACVVWNAGSMTSGYNLAMQTIPARYRIYIHQDTFIFDPCYTKNLIHALISSEYSLVGLAGSEYMPDTGRWWDASKEALHTCLLQDWVMYVQDSVTEKGIEKMLAMDALDGVLLATKESVPFRNDLFTDFHFYDVSACREYRKKGLSVGFLQLGRAGVLHEVSADRGSSSELRYEEERQKFLSEYK